MVAQHHVVMHLVPQGVNTDHTRVITLSPSTDPISIGRASKTASKGLVAAPENAYFDSPIMSRQHGKIFMSSSGAVQLQDLASTHGTWVQNKRLAAHEIRDIHDGDSITFGSTVTSGPVTYHARSFIAEFPTSCGQQASPTSSSSKGSDRSGFRVPDDQYESLSDDSDADDCKIVGSHPRTFSVPSSGDEIDESDEDLHHTATVSTSRSNASSPGDTYNSYLTSHVDFGNRWNRVDDQIPRSAKDSQEGSTMNRLNSRKTSQMDTSFDDDTEDEEPTQLGQPNEDVPTDSFKSRSCSPDVEIPDTYAAPDPSRKESMIAQHANSMIAQYANAAREEDDAGVRGLLLEISVPAREVNQDQDTVYESDEDFYRPGSELQSYRKNDKHTQQPARLDEPAHSVQANLSLEQIISDTNDSSPEPEQAEGPIQAAITPAEVRLGSQIDESDLNDIPSDLSESEDEDNDSLFGTAPDQRNTVPTLTSKAGKDRALNARKAPASPSIYPFVTRSHAETNNLAFPPFPINTNTAWLHPPAPESKYSEGETSLRSPDSILKSARAPSPSDAALVRKASSNSTPNYPAASHTPSVYHSSLYNWTTPEELSFVRFPNDMSTYAPPSNAYQSVSAYKQVSDYYPYLNHSIRSYKNGQDHYQQGPFSRSYGSSHSATIPNTNERWSSSPPPQAPPKSCVVKLKVDAKTAEEEDQDLRSTLDEVKSKKVDISNLVNPHANGTRGTKRKSDQMSCEEPLNNDAVATSESSSARLTTEDDLGPHAQARESIIVGTETVSQGLVSDTTPVPINVVADATGQEPARKKIRMSPSKVGTVGKVFSGVCLGLVTAFAAMIAATPADVWDEALREAVKLT